MLGKFTLLDIKRAPRGVPRIEVTFSININGIMNVSTMDLSTKNKKEILISQSGPAEQGRGGAAQGGSEKTVGRGPEKERGDLQEEQGHQPDLFAATS